MGTQDLTFAFAGDERVGAGVSGLLEAAGYPAIDISNADVVFTLLHQYFRVRRSVLRHGGLAPRIQGRRHLGRPEPFYRFVCLRA